MAKEIIIPDKINLEAWAEWIEYRKAKRKPVSELAANKQFKLLESYSDDQQQEIIDNSIQNDYQGLFKLRGQSNENNKPGSPQRKTKREELMQRTARDLAAVRGMGSGSRGQGSRGLVGNDQNIQQQVGHSVGGDDDRWSGYPELSGMVRSND